MSGFDPTATNSNSSGSPCKHAFHYSPALFVVEYSPAPLFLLVLVYACRVAHEKIAVVAQKRASAMGVESGLRSKIVCICYPLIAATFLLIAGILTRVAYVSIDPMSVYRIMPSAVNDVLLRIGFQLVLLALLLVMDRCVSRRRDIIFHLWTVNCGPLLTRCFLFFLFSLLSSASATAALSLTTRSWFLVLELLPKSDKTSLIRDDSLQGIPRGSADSDKSTGRDRQSSTVVAASGCLGQASCQTQCRRVGLWAAGSVTIALEVAGLFFAFDTGESNLPGLGFSAATLVQFGE